MTDAPLFSLRDIARELEIPESTVRYYRDAFVTHIATVGRGRRRRYPQEAIDVLRAIKHGYGAGKSREEIEAELSGVRVQQPVRARPRARATGAPGSAEDVLHSILEGERERREALWQMAREIVRLGEAVQHQQVVLGEIADRLARDADRALTPGNSSPNEEPGASGQSSDTEHGAAVGESVAVSNATAPQEIHLDKAPDAGSQDLAGQVDALRAELTRERELVERLRRSKLEIERRAAAAEARLDDENPDGDRREGRSLLDRFLGRRGQPEEEDV